MNPKDKIHKETPKNDGEAKKQSVGPTSKASSKIEVVKEELLQKSQISIWLDGYEDIFSDFDPRPFSQRALSEDFLHEAQKASVEKTSGGIELKLLIPKNEKNEGNEKIIKKRLHENFRRSAKETEEWINKKVRKGILVALLGMSSMMVATYIYTYLEPWLIYNLFIVLLEPTGWFMAWYGFDSVFYQAAEEKPELEFYKKMSKSQITFLPY